MVVTSIRRLSIVRPKLESGVRTQASRRRRQGSGRQSRRVCRSAIYRPNHEEMDGGRVTTPSQTGKRVEARRCKVSTDTGIGTVSEAVFGRAASQDEAKASVIWRSSSNDYGEAEGME